MLFAEERQGPNGNRARSGRSDVKEEQEQHSPDDKLRQHVLELLGGGNAHLNFDKAVADLPATLRGKRPRTSRIRRGVWSSTCGLLSRTSWNSAETPSMFRPIGRKATGLKETHRRTMPRGRRAWRHFARISTI